MNTSTGHRAAAALQHVQDAITEADQAWAIAAAEDEALLLEAIDHLEQAAAAITAVKRRHES